jgi:hypothetical protein
LIGTDRAVSWVPIGLLDEKFKFIFKFDHQKFDHQKLTIKIWDNLPLFGGIVVNSLYTPYEKFYKLWVSEK